MKYFSSRNLWICFGLVVVLSAVPQYANAQSSSAKSSFLLPKIGLNMVDYCAEILTFSNGKKYRNGCGRDAAIAFCKRAGKSFATFWDIDSTSTPYDTVHPKTLQRCFFNSHNAVTRCRGFRVIECK